MLVRVWGTVVRGLVDAVVNPSRFVQAQTRIYSASRVEVVQQILRLTGVWGVNLALYAIPLTLAGLGITSNASAPDWFAPTVSFVGVAPDTGWQLLVGFVQNSVFLTVATVVVFVTFHGGVVLTRRSRGFIQSLHTVVYTTGFYLAGIFTIVTYLSTTSGVAVARTVVLRVQANVIRWVIDLMGAELTVPGAKPGSIAFDGLSQIGATMIAVLVLFSLYFLYSLYLGARLNHRMTRADSMIVIGGVAVSPILYIAGSVAMTILLQSNNIQPI